MLSVWFFREKKLIYIHFCGDGRGRWLWGKGTTQSWYKWSISYFVEKHYWFFNLMVYGRNCILILEFLLAIDNCQNVTCQNNGSCASMFDNSSCVCQLGFNGEFCETGMISFVSSYMSSNDLTLKLHVVINLKRTHFYRYRRMFVQPLLQWRKLHQPKWKFLLRLRYRISRLTMWKWYCVCYGL